MNPGSQTHLTLRSSLPTNSFHVSSNITQTYPFSNKTNHILPSLSSTLSLHSTHIYLWLLTPPLIPLTIPTPLSLPSVAPTHSSSIHPTLLTLPTHSCLMHLSLPNLSPLSPSNSPHSPPSLTSLTPLNLLSSLPTPTHPLSLPLSSPSLSSLTSLSSLLSLHSPHSHSLPSHSSTHQA